MPEDSPNSYNLARNSPRGPLETYESPSPLDSPSTTPALGASSANSTPTPTPTPKPSELKTHSPTALQSPRSPPSLAQRSRSFRHSVQGAQQQVRTLSLNLPGLLGSASSNGASTPTSPLQFEQSGKIPEKIPEEISPSASVQSSQLSSRSLEKDKNAAVKNVLDIGVALYDYVSTKPNSLQLLQGDTVRIYQKPSTGLWQGYCESTRLEGWFPCNCISCGSGPPLPSLLTTDLPEQHGGNTDPFSPSEEDTTAIKPRTKTRSSTNISTNTGTANSAKQPTEEGYFGSKSHGAALHTHSLRQQLHPGTPVCISNSDPLSDTDLGPNIDTDIDPHTDPGISIDPSARATTTPSKVQSPYSDMSDASPVSVETPIHEEVRTTTRRLSRVDPESSAYPSSYSPSYWIPRLSEDAKLAFVNPDRFQATDKLPFERMSLQDGPSNDAASREARDSLGSSRASSGIFITDSNDTDHEHDHENGNDSHIALPKSISILPGLINKDDPFAIAAYDSSRLYETDLQQSVSSHESMRSAIDVQNDINSGGGSDSAATLAELRDLPYAPSGWESGLIMSHSIEPGPETTWSDLLKKFNISIQELTENLPKKDHDLFVDSFAVVCTNIQTIALYAGIVPGTYPLISGHGEIALTFGIITSTLVKIGLLKDIIAGLSDAQIQQRLEEQRDSNLRRVDNKKFLSLIGELKNNVHLFVRHYKEFYASKRLLDGSSSEVVDSQPDDTLPTIPPVFEVIYHTLTHSVKLYVDKDAKFDLGDRFSDKFNDKLHQRRSSNNNDSTDIIKTHSTTSSIHGSTTGSTTGSVSGSTGSTAGAGTGSGGATVGSTSTSTAGPSSSSARKGSIRPLAPSVPPAVSPYQLPLECFSNTLALKNDTITLVDGKFRIIQNIFTQLCRIVEAKNLQLAQSSTSSPASASSASAPKGSFESRQDGRKVMISLLHALINVVNSLLAVVESLDLTQIYVSQPSRSVDMGGCSTTSQVSTLSLEHLYDFVSVKQKVYAYMISLSNLLVNLERTDEEEILEALSNTLDNAKIEEIYLTLEEIKESKIKDAASVVHSAVEKMVHLIPILLEEEIMLLNAGRNLMVSSYAKHSNTMGLDLNNGISRASGRRLTLYSTDSSYSSSTNSSFWLSRDRQTSLSDVGGVGGPVAMTNIDGEAVPWYLDLEYGNEIVLDKKGNPRGGTMRALVEQLTLHSQLKSSFNAAMLLTFHSFSHAAELFECLVSRFHIQPPEGLTAEEFTTWTEKKQRPIRLRVINVMKSWLENNWLEDEIFSSMSQDAMVSEAEEDAIETSRIVLFNSMLKFASYAQDQNFPGAKTLTNLVVKRMNEIEPWSLQQKAKLKQLSRNDTLTPYPSPVLPKYLRKFKLSELDPLELARQLSIREFKLFSDISPYECLRKACRRTRFSINVNNNNREANVSTNGACITKFITNSNCLTNWVGYAILRHSEAKRRAASIKYFIDVADQCQTFHNFSSMTAIISALYSSTIHRMKKTWEYVPTKYSEKLESMNRLMNSSRNFNEYRDVLNVVQTPAVPFLGVYLTDLTFIDEGNPDFLNVEKGVINFTKRQKAANVIRSIQQFQETPYHFQELPDIQKFLDIGFSDAPSIDELYDISLSVEPRNQKDRHHDIISAQLSQTFSGNGVIY